MKTKNIIIFSIGALLTVLSFTPVLPLWMRASFAGAVYIYFGFDVYKHMFNNMKQGDILNEYFLMAIATIGAAAIGEFPDAAAVMLFYCFGEELSDGAYERSMKSLEDLMKISPEFANVERDGNFIKVSPEEVFTGEIIAVRAGEKIPLDGEIIEGVASADMSAITGESAQKMLTVGNKCVSGSVCIDGKILIKTESEYSNSIVARITKTVKEASAKKAVLERFITRFARFYTPAAVVMAVLIFTVGWITTGNFESWLKTGLCLLVISCPCALILSVPLTYYSGIGSGSKNGILFKGGTALDSASRLRTLVFDKTGTLTEGSAKIEGLYGKIGMGDIAYSILTGSGHPLASSFSRDYIPMKHYNANNISELTGKGIKGYIDSKTVLCGSRKLLAENGIEAPHEEGTLIYVSYDNQYLGFIRFNDKIKVGAAEAIKGLKAQGVERLVIMSGDKSDVVKEVADKLGIEEYYSGLMPFDKVEKFESIYKEEKQKYNKRTVAFCGDGLNDAAVIARSDIGFAMGGIGTAASIEAADVVIMNDDLSKTVSVIEIAKNTHKLAVQNVVMALGVKAIIMIISIFFYTSMELAIVADVGVSVLAVMNSLRNKIHKN